jgi:2-hydroxy-3-oxopropionate reductase
MNDRCVDDKVGFLGLGRMGWPMACRLQDAGAALRVWNRGAAKRDEARARGMAVAENPGALGAEVGPGVVCLNLSDAEAVREVFAEMKPTLATGTTIVDFGTTGHAETLELAAEAARAGAAWIDAPVSGGEVGAQAGSLSLFCGGEEAAFARVAPLLAAVGRRVTRLGGTGAGQVAKLANQLIVAQTIDAVAQALRLAELAGLDPGALREALLGGFAESRILELHGDRMARRDFVPGGRSALQLKDVRLICRLAADLGLESPTLANCLRQWERLVEDRGGGDLDHSGLFTLYDAGR